VNAKIAGSAAAPGFWGRARTPVLSASVFSPPLLRPPLSLPPVSSSRVSKSRVSSSRVSSLPAAQEGDASEARTAVLLNQSR
jgi:hypothetical protein